MANVGNASIEGNKKKSSFLSDLGLGLIGGAAGFSFDSLLSNRNAKLAEAAAERQYQRQIDFWEKQNAYNDPSAVRERLEKAGLNASALLAGGAMDAGGQAGNLSAVPGNNVDAVGRYAAVENPLSRMLQIAQLKNIEADTNEKNKNAGLLAHTIELQDSQIMLNESNRVLIDAKVLSEKATAALTDVNREIAELNRDITKATKEDRIFMIQQTADNLEAQWQILDQEYRSLKFQNDEMNPLYKEELAATIENLGVQTAYWKARAKLEDKNIQIADQELFGLTQEMYYLYGDDYTNGIRDFERTTAEYNSNIARKRSENAGWLVFGEVSHDVLGGAGSAMMGVGSLRKPRPGTVAKSVETIVEERADANGQFVGGRTVRRTRTTQ